MRCYFQQFYHDIIDYSLVKEKQIIVSIVAMLSILAIILYVTMYSLEVYTNHGESIEVPDLISLRVEDAEKLLEIRDLMIIVNDSICKGNGLGGTDPCRVQVEHPAGLRSTSMQDPDRDPCRVPE